MILETDRKVRETNFGSFTTTISKKWAEMNGIKAGDKLKHLSLYSVTVLIAPNSPILKDKELFEKFKEEMKEW